MTNRVLVSMIVGLVAVLVVSGGIRLATAQDEETDTAPYCATEAEAELLRRINDLREERGLDPLQLSQPLGRAAELKARDMAQDNYLAHISPEGQGPEELLDQVGYTYNTAIGENIAAGQRSAEGTFEQWLNSPEHREIMLGEQFTAVGIGRAHNPEAKYDWYWAAEFGGKVGEPADVCESATPQQGAGERVRPFTRA
ncbi:MAG TPA: CAP domain-containing protein [Thermomicrobiales bacterium]|nr:CAP domain-containing protein [Thermomicrobiales bacterium]